MAIRPCPTCGQLNPGPCPRHGALATDRARSRRRGRPYPATHDRIRVALAPVVAAGGVNCWRCTQPIRAGQAWDLGHDDDDPTIYRGPEHAQCNRATATRRNTAP